jgi:hypothetical protein
MSLTIVPPSVDTTRCLTKLRSQVQLWTISIRTDHRRAPDVLLEGFNLFNSATYSYTLNQASRGFGKIATDNQSRTLQLGFRFAY